MAIQNDNTLVTKGDLKELYTDKIAPYLGGGINYYYTDRTGEELKSIDMRLTTNQSISANTSQNTLLNFDKSSGTYAISDHKVIIPAGERVQINVALQASPGDSGTVDGSWQIYDYTNNTSLADANFTYVGGGYAWSSAKSIQYTAPENGALIGVKITGAFRATVVTKNSSFTVQEIGRIVDPVKYVSNNSDLQETPVGNIISYMGNSVPKHYLACDGTTYSIGTYPELEAFIINEFGSINYFGGDGVATWAVPDLRGEFLRGTGTNSHTNQGNGANIGEHQDSTEFPAYYTGIGTDNKYYIGYRIPNNVTSSDYNIISKADKNISKTSIAIYGNSKEDIHGNASTSNVLSTIRPTNTSVKYCIKYENTYHAFFNNAAYKVSVAASVAAHSGAAIAITLDNSDIIGDASLVSGNSFIAPLDGLYLIGMNWSNNGVWEQNYIINVNGADVYHVVGIGVTDMLQLQKGDVVTIKTSKTSAQSGRASFALVTSNYNPTIVSADSVYSENEQMIGYWKDGKPLYQKTLVFNNITISPTQQNLGDLSSLNIDYGTIADVNGYENGDRYFLNSSFIRCWLRVPLNNIGFISTDGTRTFSPLYVTIQYTKTTDAAGSLQVENSLLLNRPDLWIVGTEYHFGGGLYGRRFTGNTPDIAAGGNRASIQLSPASTFANARMFSFGGNITAYNSSDQLCIHPIGSKSYNNGTSPEYQGYHVDSGIYFTGDGRLQLGMMAGDHRITISNTYDVWVTYKK